MKAKLIDLSPDGSQLLLGGSGVTTRDSNQSSNFGSSRCSVAGLHGVWATCLSISHAAAWSPDGQQLIYAFNKELHIARSDGTELRKLATLPESSGRLRWSPDGSKVRFSLHEKQGSKDAPYGKSQWRAVRCILCFRTGSRRSRCAAATGRRTASTLFFRRAGRGRIEHLGGSRGPGASPGRTGTGANHHRAHGAPICRSLARTASACSSMDFWIGASFSATICSPAS